MGALEILFIIIIIITFLSYFEKNAHYNCSKLNII